jgi:DNA-binding beta-propeller fold protein YncE
MGTRHRPGSTSRGSRTNAVFAVLAAGALTCACTHSSPAAAPAPGSSEVTTPASTSGAATSAAGALTEVSTADAPSSGAAAASPTAASAVPTSGTTTVVPASGPREGGTAIRTAPVGANPGSVAVVEATQTVYVGNGDGTISVINAATCSATSSASCSAHGPVIHGGDSLVDAAVDNATDTIYFTDNEGGDVLVVNGKTCNAAVTSGCGTSPKTITVGATPEGVAVDEKTDTVYVANADDGTVSVINGATCNADTTSGCSQTPPTVTVGAQPVVPAVDEATNTIYVPNSNPDGAGSVSVINGSTCNATVTSGCGQVPPTVTVGGSPYAVTMDQSSNTAYAVDHTGGLGEVDAINGTTCDATVTTGCSQKPAVITVGSTPNDAVVNPVTHKVYVANEEDNSVSVFDATTCNGQQSKGCATPAPEMATGFNNSYLDVDTATDTVYVANQDDNTVSVLDGAACSPDHIGGCRKSSPTTLTGDGPVGVAVDQPTHTVYETNREAHSVSVINANTCNVHRVTGCATVWPTVSGTVPLQGMAVNPVTDTVYIADSEPQFDDNGNTTSFAGNTVSVLDGAHCNATVVSGCGKPMTSVTVGGGPNVVAVDATTNTIYVANFNDSTVSVIDGRTCNGTVTSGCSHKPVTVAGGHHPDGIALDTATHTLYVADYDTGRVSVVNTAVCNSLVHSGCAQKPASIGVGAGPIGIAVAAATDTVYVENYVGGTVSVINGAGCNAKVTTTCKSTPPTMKTGGRPERGVAVDQATGAVFVGSILDTAVDVFDGSTCDAKTTTGCHQVPVRVLTGGYPVGVAFDPANGTVYAPDNVDGQVSFFAPPSR